MIEFEWDDEKADTTWRTRGITFKEATTVFCDQRCLYEPDDYEHEQRERAIGMSAKPRLLLVVHTRTEEDWGKEVLLAIHACIARPTAGKARLRAIRGKDLQANPCVAVQPKIG